MLSYFLTIAVIKETDTFTVQMDGGYITLEKKNLVLSKCQKLQGAAEESY